MINIELPCKVEERVSAKTGKNYIVVAIRINDDYEMLLFPNNEQQAVIRMAFKNSKPKFKVSQQD